ncbi:MAG: BrnA antitoxin family protein [Anaerolineae bacterium]
MNKSLTNWEQLDALEDEDIDLSDTPEITPEMFARAVVRHGLKLVLKEMQVTLHLDSDVLAWFKAQGRDYQTRINALLRAYMDAHSQQSSK